MKKIFCVYVKDRVRFWAQIIRNRVFDTNMQWDIRNWDIPSHHFAHQNIPRSIIPLGQYGPQLRGPIENQPKRKKERENQPTGSMIWSGLSVAQFSTLLRQAGDPDFK